MARELGDGRIVVNVANGPGSKPDPNYTRVVQRFRDQHVPVCGYVDLRYGSRDMADVLGDAARWAEDYDVREVFLDCAPSDPEQLPFTEDVVLALRAAGVRYIVANHGMWPASRYLTLSDLAITFEGPWSDYLDATTRDRPVSTAVDQVGHLVHGLPIDVPACTDALAQIINRARQCGAGWIGAATTGGTHEWETPAWW
jgi:hypothetical protein